MHAAATHAATHAATTEFVLNSTLFVPNREKQTENTMRNVQMNGWNRTKRHRNALTIALY